MIDTYIWYWSSHLAKIRNWQMKIERAIKVIKENLSLHSVLQGGEKKNNKKKQKETKRQTFRAQKKEQQKETERHPLRAQQRSTGKHATSGKL